VVALRKNITKMKGEVALFDDLRYYPDHRIIPIGKAMGGVLLSWPLAQAG